jgi:hypothetical protein
MAWLSIQLQTNQLTVTFFISYPYPYCLGLEKSAVAVGAVAVLIRKGVGPHRHLGGELELARHVLGKNVSLEVIKARVFVLDVDEVGHVSDNNHKNNTQYR